MSFKISVKGLALFAYHGVFAEEKTIGQRFYLTIDFRVGDEAALASDAIEQSISYADVVERATAIFTGSKFNMIETAAARVADGLMADFAKMEWVSVTVSKPAAPVTAIIDTVEATVERARNG